MPDKVPIITLTTDFGEADYYVAAMKGVISSISPSAAIIDITHLVPPHDIYSAALTLMCCYREFPKRTIHLVVVDPGVGSNRRPILVVAGDYSFIGPDNGVFSYIYQREDLGRVVELTSEHYFRSPVSNTFHGRDIFAPCAAYLSKGIDPDVLGEEIDDPVRFNIPAARVSGSQVLGTVIHVDRFGNIITNITASELSEDAIARGAVISIGKHQAARVLSHFAEAGQGELFAYFGSAGLLELAVPRQSAARVAEAKRGMEVTVAIKVGP
jgi:S-adenosylmethionine hydrolase